MSETQPRIIPQEPRIFKTYGFKYADDACRHGVQCRGCQGWFCADDEVVECERCHEAFWCPSCFGIPYGTQDQWKTNCRECRQEIGRRDRDKIRLGLCQGCNRLIVRKCYLSKGTWCHRCTRKLFSEAYK